MKETDTMPGKPLKKEDYAQPACPLCMSDARPLPLARIIEKLDTYFAMRDIAGAERHLTYWLREGEMNRDLRGIFALENELMGLYRKNGDEKQALYYADRALNTGEKLSITQEQEFCTCLVNAATVYACFDRPREALSLFQRAQAIFSAATSPDLYALGSMKNNMARVLSGLSEYDQAEKTYLEAIRIMQKLPDSAAEIASTWLNLADNALLRLKDVSLSESCLLEEKAEGFIEKAYALLMDHTLEKNTRNAYALEKCAGALGNLGYFVYENAVAKRAEEFYAGI